MRRLTIETNLGVTGYLDIPEWILGDEPQKTADEIASTLGFIIGGIVGNRNLRHLCGQCNGKVLQ